jgi:hypothetical protein
MTQMIVIIVIENFADSRLPQESTFDDGSDAEMERDTQNNNNRQA